MEQDKRRVRRKKRRRENFGRGETTVSSLSPWAVRAMTVFVALAAVGGIWLVITTISSCSLHL